ncbi:hypothetical protein N7450_007684 [Penicillium hetheringtonii]|uniref:Uncharacterized protein n=1 Tax=Penicillium hetheringtonii TaxID=911720 RepID=A0AAD6DET9_9EURO|nr:hypothetical protein N7450_007684 [Penicillium hetheringtonii]
MAPGTSTSAQPSTLSLVQASVAQGSDSYDNNIVQDPKFQAGFQMWSRTRELEEQIETLKREMERMASRKQVMIEEVLERSNVEKEAHTRTREGVQSLERAIAEKSKTIDGLKEEIEKAQSKAESWKLKYARERDNVACARSEINDLQDRVNRRESTIKELQSIESDLRERHAVLEVRIRDMRTESTNLNQLLTATNARLNELEGFATGFSELDEKHLIDGYTHLWDFARAEIYCQLETDLDNKVLRDRSAWEGLRNCSLTLQHRVPLPSSNSLAAKQMRFAIILAILAREIDKYIFQPTYIGGEDCPSRPLLANLAAANTEKEAVCRSILFSLQPESKSKSCQWRIQRIVQNVSSYIYALLSEEQNSRFCESLEKVVQKAVEVWYPIQHSRRKYESGFEADNDDELIPFVFPGLESVDTPSSVNPQRQHSLIINPHIYAIEENKKILFTPTWLLSNMDPQWVAAEREMDQDSSQSTLERVMSTRLRKFIGRKSINSH